MTLQDTNERANLLTSLGQGFLIQKREQQCDLPACVDKPEDPEFKENRLMNHVLGLQTWAIALGIPAPRQKSQNQNTTTVGTIPWSDWLSAGG